MRARRGVCPPAGSCEGVAARLFGFDFRILIGFPGGTRPLSTLCSVWRVPVKLPDGRRGRVSGMITVRHGRRRRWPEAPPVRGPEGSALVASQARSEFAVTRTFPV